MKREKLNINWEIEQFEFITRNDSDLIFKIELKPSNFEHIDQGDTATLSFRNVAFYAITACSPQAYSEGNYRFNENQIPFGGHFYELSKSNWKSEFPKEKEIIQESIIEKQYKHFILFSSLQILEIICETYVLSYTNSIDEQIEERYPKGYLSYYLNLFSNHFDKAILENYQTCTQLYIQLLGKNELLDLQKEIKQIKKNQDQLLFLKYMNQIQKAYFDNKQLNLLLTHLEKIKA
jgi:hypothetical protein